MTNVRTCACGKPLRPSDTVCSDCVHRTRNYLANQAAWLEDIETELEGLSRKMAANDGGRASPETTWQGAMFMPLDEITPQHLREWDRRKRAAANVMHEQRALLVAWSRLIMDERPELIGPTCRHCTHDSCTAILRTRWPADSVPAMSMFVESYLPQLRSHDAGPDLVAEFRGLGHRIIRVVDSHENRTRIHVGPCPESYSDEYGRKEPCAGQVEAIVPADEAIAPVMRCGACKVEFRSDQWVRAGHRIQQREAQMKQQKTLAEAMGRKAS